MDRGDLAPAGAWYLARMAIPSSRCHYLPIQLKPQVAEPRECTHNVMRAIDACLLAYHLRGYASTNAFAPK